MDAILSKAFHKIAYRNNGFTESTPLKHSEHAWFKMVAFEQRIAWGDIFPPGMYIIVSLADSAYFFKIYVIPMRVSALPLEFLKRMESGFLKQPVIFYVSPKRFCRYFCYGNNALFIPFSSNFYRRCTVQKNLFWE